MSEEKKSNIIELNFWNIVWLLGVGAIFFAGGMFMQYMLIFGNDQQLVPKGYIYADGQNNSIYDVNHFGIFNKRTTVRSMFLCGQPPTSIGKDAAPACTQAPYGSIYNVSEIREGAITMNFIRFLTDTETAEILNQSSEHNSMKDVQKSPFASGA